MNLRQFAATGAALVVTTLGAAGTTGIVSATAAAPARQDVAPVEDLDAAAAQQILRSVVDPQTTPDDAAQQIDSTDPAIGSEMHAFAVSASGAGYTPDVFTVSAVSPAGPDLDNADTQVASPHVPFPIPFPLTFTRSGGVWKLSADSAGKLIGMTGGPH